MTVSPSAISAIGRTDVAVRVVSGTVGGSVCQKGASRAGDSMPDAHRSQRIEPAPQTQLWLVVTSLSDNGVAAATSTFEHE